MSWISFSNMLHFVRHSVLTDVKEENRLSTLLHHTNIRTNINVRCCWPVIMQVMLLTYCAGAVSRPASALPKSSLKKDLGTLRQLMTDFCTDVLPVSFSEIRCCMFGSEAHSVSWPNLVKGNYRVGQIKWGLAFQLITSEVLLGSSVYLAEYRAI